MIDSHFFTQDDPYQGQGDERQPRYLMGSHPAGKYEGKLLLQLPAVGLLQLHNPSVHKTFPHWTHRVPSDMQQYPSVYTLPTCPMPGKQLVSHSCQMS